MKDNRVEIDVSLNNSDIEKGASEIKGEFGGLKTVAKDMEDVLSKAFSDGFDKTVANANARVNELKQRLETVTASLKIAIADGDDSAAERYGRQQVRIYDQLEAARERLSIALRAAAQKDAEKEIKEAKRAAAAKKREEEKQYRDATKGIRRFGSRFKEIVSGALVFNLISAGLRKMTEYFGKALKTNSEFTRSFAQLKGALMTAFQPIYEAVLPAILSLMKGLTAAIQVIGQFFATLSGKSYSQMQQNAEALNNQANAIDGVGSAAKKAKRQLAGFDQITKLDGKDTESGGGGSASTIAPTFETVAMTDSLENILELIGAVGAALLTWKIASAFITDLSTVLGIGIAVGGAVQFVTDFIDAFNNGVDWENLSGMLLGAVALAGGLFVAFGSVGAAVGLLVAGIGLLIVSLKDWITTGELSTEGCFALVAGIVAIGAAIALFTSGWIPLIIAAVVGLVVLVIKYWDEICAIFSKAASWFNENVIQPIARFFSNLWDGVKSGATALWSAIVAGFKGLVNGVIGFINGMISAMVNGVNSVIRALNRISITVPDWVPGLGGVTFGFNIGYLTAPQIPFLAQGAVLPPNKPFLAMVGDQRHGTNVEAPLSTIQEAVAAVMDGQISAMLAGFEALLEENRQLRHAVESIEVGDTIIGQAAARYERRRSLARGGAL